VKSVLTVTVVDDMEPSHSDEAIEACMEDLNVQFWNWYKIDLCSDVIFNSAKYAKDVTLYSSGNNAVLLGWSSSAGLARLERVSLPRGCELLAQNIERMVTVGKGTHIYPGGM
jgi:hypothetical protein